MYTAINSLIFGAYALTTVLPSFLTAPPTWEQPVSPEVVAECKFVRAFEDGSRLAECLGYGFDIAYDPDGQLHVNDAGVPLRAPGQWYVVE